MTVLSVPDISVWLDVILQSNV